MPMFHERDPAEVVRESVGDLSGIDLFHNLVLVGMYKRPDKTKGGIIITDNTKAEERFQGVVGLVLKVGPAAFVDDAVNKFYGMSVKPGDWVAFRTSDAHNISINGTICRLLEDAAIKARIAHPDLIY